MYNEILKYTNKFAFFCENVGFRTNFFQLLELF